MAIALRSVGVSPGSDDHEAIIVKPAGLAVGDLMISHTLHYAVVEATAPANWTKIFAVVYGMYHSVVTFWKIADAADVAATDFTFHATASSCVGAISAWTGHDPTTPIGASNGQYNAASTTVTAPTITPLANSMILLLCSVSDNNTQSTYAIATSNPATWAEAYDLPKDLNDDEGISMGYALRPETTDTGNGTATTSGSDANSGILIAISPIVTVVTHFLCSLGVGK